MIYIAFVEDKLTQSILRNILDRKNLNNAMIVVKHGAGNLKSNITEYNRVAKSQNIIVLRDQDQIPCPPMAVDQWLPRTIQNPGMIFHVIEHEIEAWLMADRVKFAQWLNCKVNEIPSNPDTVIDPKQKLFSLVRNSKRNELKRAILPHGTARQGPEYNFELGRFVDKHWRLDHAVKTSNNLKRFIKKLKSLNP